MLFLLGCLGLFVINAKKISDRFKEQIAVTIFFKDGAKEVEIQQLQRSLLLAKYAKEVSYISKEEAAEKHIDDLGENFIDYLGYNPLKNSIDLFVKADYVTTDSLSNIALGIKDTSFVEEVAFDKPLVGLITDNIKRFSFWTLVISIFFAIMAMFLINSTIRLAVYAKRFIIKTMQMVGATKRFIRRPFVLKGVLLGVIGATIACVGLAAVVFYLNQNYATLGITENPLLLIGLFICVFLVGIFITWLSTYIATQRYLNLNTDDLY